MISQHSVVALAVSNGGQFQLDVLSCDITLDAYWSPYAQATIVVGNTIESNKSKPLDLTDPFYDTRVFLYLTESFGNSEKLSYLTTLYSGDKLSNLTTTWAGKTLGQLTALWYQPYNALGVISDVRRYLNLKVRSASIDMETQQITLGLASDESLLQDYGLIDTVPYQPNRLTAKTAVEYALSKIGAFLQAGASDAAITADASVWEPGDDAWGYVQSLLDQARLRLYCDEQRRWYLTDSYITANSRTIAYGTDYTALRQEVTLDGEFYSAAVVKYSWTDDSNVQQVAYDTFVNGRYNYVKVKRVEYNRRYPGPGAAEAMVMRQDAKTVSRTVQLVNNYAWTPGDGIFYQDNYVYPPLDSVNPPSGRIMSVSWSLPSDIMTVETKLSHRQPVSPAGGPAPAIGDLNTDMGA